MTYLDRPALLESYREGYGDALLWVLRNCDLTDDDRERIDAVLDDSGTGEA